MNHVETYPAIEDKKADFLVERLSDEEAMIRVLDLMDFYAALKSANKELEEGLPGVAWIDVKDSE